MNIQNNLALMADHKMMARVFLLLLVASAYLTQATYEDQALDMARMTISGQISDEQREAILSIIQKLSGQVKE